MSLHVIALERISPLGVQQATLYGPFETQEEALEFAESETGGGRWAIVLHSLVPAAPTKPVKPPKEDKPSKPPPKHRGRER
jgi:hypothetical protein